MVSIYGPDGNQAYGVITDVSVGGANIVVGVGFQAGASLLLRIGFDPDSPFSTSGEVVWCRNESDEKHRASFSHGVRFLISDPEQIDRLRAILERFRTARASGATGRGVQKLLLRLKLFFPPSS